eukprot:3565898-Rhodomonas_salina.1
MPVLLGPAVCDALLDRACKVCEHAASSLEVRHTGALDELGELSKSEGEVGPGHLDHEADVADNGT